MTRYILLGLLLLITGGCVSVSLFPGPGPLEEKEIAGKGSSKVLVVDISGILSSVKPNGLLDRPSLLAQLKEELSKASEDTNVKALVVRINSPGGTVTASDILYHEILAFKEKRRVPVVVSIMDLGTSGGYYVALAGDRIIAHPSSVTGSLGVIMVSLNAAGLMKKIGLEATSVTSGPNKDMGSPFKEMTEEQRQIFQSVIDSLYARFLEVIYQGRPTLNPDDIRKMADGRIYSAQQAKELGLIDDIGYLDDAIDIAKKEAGLPQARVVMYHRPGEYQHNIYSQLTGPRVGLDWVSGLNGDSLPTLMSGGTPKFMYLWLP